MLCEKQSPGMGMAMRGGRRGAEGGRACCKAHSGILSRGSFPSSSSIVDYLKGPAPPLINLAISNCPPTPLWFSQGAGRGKFDYKGGDSSIIHTTAFPGLLLWARYCAPPWSSPTMNRCSRLVSGSPGDSPRNEPCQPHSDLMEESTGCYAREMRGI